MIGSRGDGELSVGRLGGSATRNPHPCEGHYPNHISVCGNGRVWSLDLRKLSESFLHVVPEVGRRVYGSQKFKFSTR